MDSKLLGSAALIIVSLACVIGGMWNRNKLGKGIGWQFIRYNTVAIALPLMGVLALNGVLTEAATAILSGTMGYVFGKQSGEETNESK